VLHVRWDVARGVHLGAMFTARYDLGVLKCDKVNQGGLQRLLALGTVSITCHY
jgi:hypothetical protein